VNHESLAFTLAVMTEPDEWRTKDARGWRIGSEAEVEWIARGTTHGFAITSAIPPMFEAYATLELPGTPGVGGSWSADVDDLEEQRVQDARVVALLSKHTTASQPWWLGYLETGIGAETIFYDVAKVKLYADWSYVLIQAGAEQAGSWRERDLWKGVLPDLIFSADHAWLISTLWDDHWRCIGGSEQLISALLARIHRSVGGFCPAQNEE